MNTDLGPSPSATAMSSLRDQAGARLDPSGFQRLADLAARVEDCGGEDRELDAEIHALLFGTVETHLGTTYRDAWDRTFGHSHPFKFTLRVDHAEIALPGPEWPEWQITRRFGTGYHATVGLGADGVGCETAALALTSAALRARAASAIEARRAETGTGSVHESAVAEGQTPNPSHLSSPSPQEI